MLVCANSARNIQVFSALRQSCADADPMPMVWPTRSITPTGRKNLKEFARETLSRVVEKRTGRTTPTVEKNAACKRGVGSALLLARRWRHLLGRVFMLREAAAIRESAERKNAA